MTPEQIRRCCEEASAGIAYELVNLGSTLEIESLCREAMVEGLEMAARLEEAIRLDTDEMTRLCTISDKHGAAQAIAATCNRFGELCREQVNKLKEI